MPHDFHNELYSQGTAGFIDFIWLWYHRISLIIAFAVLVIAIILAIIAALAPKREGFGLLSVGVDTNACNCRQIIEHAKKCQCFGKKSSKGGSFQTVTI